MNYTKFIIVNDSKTVSQFLSCPSYSAISLDLEGHNLCRHGEIYTIQAFIPSLHSAFIFDCRKLDKSDVVDCFKKVLSDSGIKKYMFDCRSDADALYHQYGLLLNNVIDIQLYEIGYRKSTGNGSGHYHGLFKSLRMHADSVDISSEELKIKDKINIQHRDKNYEVDLKSSEMLKYLLIDVYYLERLFNIFVKRITAPLLRKIKEESIKRQDIWKKDIYVNNRSNAVSAF